jgi:hypothetical protein
MARWDEYFLPRMVKGKLGMKEGVYKALSTHFSHPNKYESILQILKDEPNNTTSTILYPEYDKEKCEFVFLLAIMLGWSSLMHLNHPFRDYLSKNMEWRSHYRSFNKIILLFIEEKIVKKSGVKFKFKDKLPECY